MIQTKSRAKQSSFEVWWINIFNKKNNKILWRNGKKKKEKKIRNRKKIKKWSFQHIFYKWDPKFTWQNLRGSHTSIVCHVICIPLTGNFLIWLRPNQQCVRLHSIFDTWICGPHFNATHFSLLYFQIPPFSS